MEILGLYNYWVFAILLMIGFYAVYGFVACVLLVLLAKEMRKVLIRKEDYYDTTPPSGDDLPPPGESG